MEREEFIKSLGISLAIACAGSCLAACSKSAIPATGTPATAGVTIDLSAVPTVGSQTTSGSVLIYRIATGNVPASFVATEAACPHQGGVLKWIEASNFVQCQLHQSEYKTDGTVIQGPQGITGTTRALIIYTVTISGTKLTAS